MKPLIAITCSAMTSPRTGKEYGRLYLERDYVTRTLAAGGNPILIPPGTDPAPLANLIDGWIIPGGDDFDPALYGEEPHPENGREVPERTQTELALYQALPPDTPVLGICYGCQLYNVIQGGTLHQHLPDILGDDRHRGDHLQTYRVEPGSRLHTIVGDQPTGKSWHHQAVKTVAPTLRPVAWHEDGTIEALESTHGRWFLGIQWHPERTDAPESQLLFNAFVKEASTRCSQPRSQSSPLPD